MSEQLSLYFDTLEELSGKDQEYMSQKYRLENEYNVDIRLETLPYEHIRWIANKEEVKVDKIVGTSDMKKVTDLKGNPLLLFVNSWSVGMTEDRNPGLILTEFSK